MMKTVTFESMPNLIGEILQKLDYLLSQTQKSKKNEEDDRLLSIESLIDYLPEHPARQTIYGWVNNRSIPYEKHGKRLYFRKSDIDSWLANGRKVISEILQDLGKTGRRSLK